jgi:hypothetical protein
MSYANNNTLKRGHATSWQQKNPPKKILKGFCFSSWGKSKYLALFDYAQGKQGSGVTYFAYYSNVASDVSARILCLEIGRKSKRPAGGGPLRMSEREWIDNLSPFCPPLHKMERGKQGVR